MKNFSDELARARGRPGICGDHAVSQHFPVMWNEVCGILQERGNSGKGTLQHSSSVPTLCSNYASAICILLHIQLAYKLYICIIMKNNLI